MTIDLTNKPKVVEREQLVVFCYDTAAYGDGDPADFTAAAKAIHQPLGAHERRLVVTLSKDVSRNLAMCGVEALKSGDVAFAFWRVRDPRTQTTGGSTEVEPSG